MKICNCKVIKRNPSDLRYHETEVEDDWCLHCGHYAIDYSSKETSIKLVDPEDVKLKYNKNRKVDKEESRMKKIQKFKEKRERILKMKEVLVYKDIARAMNLGVGTVTKIINMTGHYSSFKEYIKD